MKSQKYIILAGKVALPASYVQLHKGAKFTANKLTNGQTVAFISAEDTYVRSNW